MNNDWTSMPRARVVCVSDDEKSFSALTAAFEKAGYALAPPDLAVNADLGIADLRRKTFSDKKILAITNLLRRKSPDCSLFLIVDPDLAQASRNALKRYGEIICISDSADPLVERCRQMLRLRNVVEETGERLKTLATLNRLADFPAITAENAPPRILIAGEPGPAALSVISAVGKIAEHTVCALSAGQVMRALDHGKFDCAVFLPADENDPLLSLSRVLRRHREYCWTPIVYAAGDAAASSEYARKGAKDFILTDWIGDELAAKVRLAARRSRLLKSMRNFLQASAGDGVRDPASGAFTLGFLAEHGARLCARADQTGRRLCVIAVHLSAQGVSNARAEPGRRALHQAARLINRVTRAEDTVARIGANTFMILMPATIEDDAAKAALRMEGVLENTVFRSARDDIHYAAKARTAVCGRPEECCVEETVALALNQLREGRRSSITQPLRRSPQ